MGDEFDKLRALMQATKQNIFEMHNMISEWSKTSNIKDELTGQIVNELSHKIADLAGAWYDMNAHIESIEPVEPKTPAEPEKESTVNEHFGEEQAEGLDNLLEGLKDTPHDNRW